MPKTTFQEGVVIKKEVVTKNPIPLPSRNGVSFSPGHTPTLWVNGY
jgi:hypothetical protein